DGRVDRQGRPARRHPVPALARADRRPRRLRARLGRAPVPGLPPHPATIRGWKRVIHRRWRGGDEEIHRRGRGGRREKKEGEGSIRGCSKIEVRAWRRWWWSRERLSKPPTGSPRINNKSIF